MFGDQMTVPLVIRLIVGRGWGQGPQHSQTLHSFFAHIPGLKVALPSNAYDAKGLLVAAAESEDPVIFIEHRWLHNVFGPVPEELYRVPFGQAKIMREGSDLTIVATSHMTLEAWRALTLLEGEISAELIDLRTIRPLDRETILRSVRKTGRLLVLDGDWAVNGFASEILALVAEEALSALKEPPVRLTYPDAYSPTSWMQANHYFPTAKEIALAALRLLNRKTKAQALLEEILAMKQATPLDTPDALFTGPF